MFETDIFLCWKDFRIFFVLIKATQIGKKPYNGLMNFQ